MPIQLSCEVTPNSAMTVYSYECSVTLGSSQQDTLVCTVDGVPRMPCEFFCLQLVYS